MQACISVRSDAAHVLLDCGTSALIAMKRLGVDPNTVDAVAITHLHGDHFGGLSFLVLDGQFSQRQRPLLVAGPLGTRERVTQAMEVLFPGSSRVERRFQVHFLELEERAETPLVGPFSVAAYPVPHPSGAPAYALRLAGLGKVIAYSGDTAWSEVLLEVAREADLFICEAYSYEKRISHHLDYATLREHRSRLDCRRLVLTHLGADMLSNLAHVSEEIGQDGLEITV
ncbi:MAG TPA: MBL fold metallo-hydrolase [Chloroflexota bacterium]|nr:MBL fold metallo-hydrolase [Chloroflexota bacterium]